MAMRPRGSSASAPRRAARPGGVRPVYEDFKPVSEWQQDDESHFLNIYLPGFMKEQIRVSTEGRNSIRVQGERLVAGNKWSRFREEYQVPENGEMNSVRAKYQGGVLNITIPKKEFDKAQETLPPKPNTTDTQKQPIPQKGHEKVLPEVNTSKSTEEKSSELKRPSDDSRTKQAQDGDEKQTNPQQGQDKAFPAVGTSQLTDDKTSEAQKQLTNHRKDHDHDRDQGRDGRNITPLKNRGAVVSQDAGKRESEEPKENHIASERPDDVTTKMVNKEGKKSEESKELPGVETAKNVSEKVGAAGIPERKADNNELHGAFTKEKYKKAVKGLAELSEERQLLVNMGVAVLVIVALTAYVTFQFASGKDKN
ncbi:Inactive protein RESTRICTED TEV MOVEMENT 2 [Sesamum alatum]|uniref:Inactive protein RESTRICTED TEV MOVEMENT 2 n=1 Tax=Sesamum alatum TaxID=300844 RepID=A0AAE1Y7Y1_9LAMI|nr:Inactive protein RESTRICTED TEV MOVEMENT 2 [Sesamum alatum]